MPRLTVKMYQAFCEECDLPIIEEVDWVRDLGEMVFHIECFSCYKCNTQIASGARFGLRHGRPVCERHFIAETPEETDDEEESGATGGDTEPQKVKRHRTVISEDQVNELKRQFEINSTPNGHALAQIATSVGLTKKIVQVWFQNRRARKRKEGHQVINAATAVPAASAEAAAPEGMTTGVVNPAGVTAGITLPEEFTADLSALTGVPAQIATPTQYTAGRTAPTTTPFQPLLLQPTNYNHFTAGLSASGGFTAGMATPGGLAAGLVAPGGLGGTGGPHPGEMPWGQWYFAR